MAVIVQYIVVRDGVQKMTFTTKKEADAYDKMLDIADNLYDFIESAEFLGDEKLLEDISFFIAQNKDQVMSILRGAKPKKISADRSKKSALDDTAEKPDKEPAGKEAKSTTDDEKTEPKGKKAKKK